MNKIQTDPETLAKNLETQKKLIELTQEWNESWSSRSKDFFDFYDQTSYSKAQGSSFTKFREQKEYLFKMHWIHIKHEKISILQGPGYWVTWFDQYYRAPNIRTEGTRRLYWQADENGTFKVVGMEWIPAKLGLEDAFIRDAQKSIPDFIETWKNTWKATDDKKYATFYKKDAVQDSQKMINEIVAQKKFIWKLKKPTNIEFSDITIDIADDAVYVAMKQTYSDTSGYKDVGIKKLVLYPHGNSWLIASEKWTKK